MAKSGGRERSSSATPATSPPIAFQVLGTPAPKGSATAFVVKNKSTGKHRAVIVQGGAKGSAGRERLRGWDAAVRDAAARAVGPGRTSPPFVGVALRVDIEFRIARPANHYGTGRNAGVLKPSAPPFPIGKPDRDKLERTTLDAMTGIVFDDDSRVVAGEPRKVWATPGNEGAAISVRECRPDEADAIGATPHPSPALAGAVVLRLVPPPASVPSGKASPDDVGGAAGPTFRADTAKASAQISRVRELVEGTVFAAESHAMRRHGPRPQARERCDGEHAAPACADPLCYHGAGTPDTRAFPDDADDFGGPDL